MRRLFRRITASLRHPSPFLVMGVLLVICASFTLAQPAKAIEFFSWDSLNIWIGKGLLGIVGLIGNLLLAAINQLLAVAAYNDFGNAPAVVKGWVIVRDLANMTFIIFLLIISFGTILRIENYRYNQLLSRLLLMAVLINFSKLITLFMIDGAQVVMLTFVSAFRDAAAGNLTTAFGLQDSLRFLQNDKSVSDVSSLSVLVTVLLALAIYYIAFIVTLVILVVLVIRVFALWVLIILSPLAYALRAFPNTRSQSTRWWSEFSKYVTTGPIIAFFLWLALSVMASDSLTKGFSIEQNSASLVPGSTEAATTPVTAALSEISSTPKLLSFMLAISFLLTGLSVAQGMGGAAGKIAGDWSERIKKGGLKAASVPLLPAIGAAKLAKYGVSRLGRKVQTDLAETGTFFGKKVPISKKIYGGRLPFITKEFWEGFSERGDDRRKGAMQRVKGMGKRSVDVLAQFTATRDLHKARELAGEYDVEAHTALLQSNIAEHRKSQGPSADDEESIVKTAHQVRDKGGAQGSLDRQGALLHATNESHMDDVFAALSWKIHNELLADKKEGLKVTKSQVWDDKEGKMVELTEIPKSIENYQRFALKYLNMDPDKFTTGDNAARLKAAQDATFEEKENLRLLSNMSYATLDANHPQQFYGLRDTNTDTDFIPTIDEAVKKQVNNMSKRSMNDLLLKMVPWMGVMNMVGEKTDAQGNHVVRNSLRTDDLDPMQLGLMRALLTKAIVPETRRIPIRNPDQWLKRFVDDEGVLISDLGQARQKGFESVEDLQQEFKKYMAIAPEGLEAIGRQRFNGDGKTGVFPAASGSAGSASRPVQNVSSHFNYPDLAREASAAGYGGVQDGQLLAIDDILKRPEFAAAFGQFTQSQIDERSIRTGKDAEEVKQSLQSEAESSLRNALKNVIPELKTAGEGAGKMREDFIESLMTHGKKLTSETFEDVPPPSLHVGGETYAFPTQLIGTPEAREAATGVNRMKNNLDSFNINDFSERLDRLTDDLEKSFTELSDSFRRGAGRVGNVKLAEPIENSINKLRDELSHLQREGRLEQKEGQREYLEHTRRFYRTFNAALAHGSSRTKKGPEPKK